VPNDDERLVGVMTHEYALLIQSYKEFLYLILANKKSHDDEIKFYLYNSYARVILHLYEFLKSCVAREISKTQSENNESVKAYIAGEIAKMAGRRKLPIDLSKFEDFAENLRKYRNKVSGHVLKERLDQYPLSDFYSSYHVYIAWFLQDTEYWWGAEMATLTRHQSITNFSDLLTFGQRNEA
jgi:hypothetical protein